MKSCLHFFNINSHLPYDMLLSCHTIGMTMRTLVVPMRRFLFIFPFQVVSTIKKRTWSNQDIHAWLLGLTTVAPTRVWVIKFCMYEYCVIWQLQVFFMLEQDSSRFFQWIDEPELVDRQILLFLYDRNESSPLRSFKRWVPPPPMADEEKNEASTHRVYNPTVCKCGYHAELVNPQMLYILLWLKYLVYVNDSFIGNTR
jgi:hypothetical protein